MSILNSTGVSLFYILLGCILLFYVLFLIKNIKLLKFAATNNGFFVPILPFVGTVYMGLFTGDELNILSTTNFFKKLFGFPCNIWMSHHYIMVNTDPAEIKIILNHPKSMDKPTPFYENFHIVSKDTLFLFSYDKWRQRRKHVMKSYKPKVLKTYQQTFYKQSCDLLEDLRNQKVPENLFDFCNSYSFKNFFLTSVGLAEEQIDLEQMLNFGVIFDELQKIGASLIVDPVTPLHIWLKLFPKGQRMTELIASSKFIVKSIIEQKKEQHTDSQAFTENANELPLMDSLLYVNSKRMSDDEIFGEMILFSAAATETSGNATAFCLTCLGMNPNIQEKIYDEVMSVIGHNSISNEDLSNLKYTEAVILETLRLFPVLPLVGRYIGADIDVGSRVIPKGTNYVISIFDLHRDPKYWDNPLDFDPTRFLPGKVENIQPYTYLPFSGGPRDCIGKAQAMMLMKTTIANIVRNFRLTSKIKSVEDIQLSSCVTMRSTKPLYCSFTAR